MIELWISMIELWISIIELWISIFNYGYPQLNYGYPQLRGLCACGFPYIWIMNLNRNYQFANSSPWHKNAFYRVKFPKNNHRPTLTSSAQTCSNWRCASSALCLHFKPRALVWRRPPSAHLWRQPLHSLTLTGALVVVAQLSKQTVTSGSRFLIEWFIELDVMSFHGQNSSFYESRSFAKHYIQVSPPNNYNSRHQVSSQNLESRRLNVAMWADDLLMWLKSAKEHSLISTQELSTDSTLTKNTRAWVD